MSKIKILNDAFDISELSDNELVELMKDRCELYNSTETETVYQNIIRIAKELIRRGDEERSIRILERTQMLLKYRIN